MKSWYCCFAIHEHNINKTLSGFLHIFFKEYDNEFLMDCLKHYSFSVVRHSLVTAELECPFKYMWLKLVCPLGYMIHITGHCNNTSLMLYAFQITGPN